MTAPFLTLSAAGAGFVIVPSPAGGLERQAITKEYAMDMMKMPENVTFEQGHAVFGIKMSPQLVEWLEQLTTANERAMRREVKAILETVSAMLTLLSDPVAREIINLITLHMMRTREKARFTSSEMSDAIVKQFGGDESAKKIFSPRRIGKTIMKFEHEFSELFRWTSSIWKGLTYYNFSGLNSEIAGGVR